MTAKIFRDPLYNYISIERDTDQWLLDLLDCPEVQRLRRIHQLGVSYLTYPGADHNRLSHSLGVLHLMQQALLHLGSADRQVGRARDPLLAVALLHDVGHGPSLTCLNPVWASTMKYGRVGLCCPRKAKSTKSSAASIPIYPG
jgi:HD superfamily phosphohydrolase